MGNWFVLRVLDRLWFLGEWELLRGTVYSVFQVKTIHRNLIRRVCFCFCDTKERHTFPVFREHTEVHVCVLCSLWKLRRLSKSEIINK